MLHRLRSSLRHRPPSSSSSSSTTKRPKVEVRFDHDDRYRDRLTEFREVLTAVKQMRSRRDAPVDSHGAEVLAERPSATVSVSTFRFQTLVSLLLSSQTQDPVTAAAVRRLQAELPGGLTVEAVRRADEAELEEIIKGVGFHRKKAVFLKKTAEMLHEKWEGNVPDSLEDLVALPGIGTKMAKIVLSVGFGKVEGIAADTHVHRIAGRLGWTKGFKISKPADTEKALEAWIPREEWDELNLLLVGFGQQICLPRNPKCSECLAKKWCPKIGVRANKNSKKEKDLV